MPLGLRLSEGLGVERGRETGSRLTVKQRLEPLAEGSGCMALAEAMDFNPPRRSRVLWLLLPRCRIGPRCHEWAKLNTVLPKATGKSSARRALTSLGLSAMGQRNLSAECRATSGARSFASGRDTRASRLGTGVSGARVCEAHGREGWRSADGLTVDA